MALRQANMVYERRGSTAVSLSADADESIRIKGIYVSPNAAETFLNLLIDRVAVQSWRIYGKGGNNLPFATIHPSMNLLDWLTGKGFPMTIPLASGQTLTATLANAGTDVIIVYDLYDAGDVQPNEINGTGSAEFNYLNYISNGTAVTPGNAGLLDTSDIPAEFPAFPAGVTVPPRYEITLFGLAGSPVDKGSAAANSGLTGYVKLVRDRKTLFDTAMNGIPFRSLGTKAVLGTEYNLDYTLIGELAAANLAEPLWLPEPLVMLGGEELLVYIGTVAGDAVTPYAIGDLQLTMIMKARRAA